MKLQVDIKALEEIRSREVTHRDNVPEHTLDWYTYDNRVKLIDEIADSFIQIVKVSYDDMVADEHAKSGKTDEVKQAAKESTPHKVSKKKAEAITEKIITPITANAGDPTDDLPKQS